MFCNGLSLTIVFINYVIYIHGGGVHFWGTDRKLRNTALMLRCHPDDCYLYGCIIYIKCKTKILLVSENLHLVLCSQFYK